MAGGRLLDTWTEEIFEFQSSWEKVIKEVDRELYSSLGQALFLLKYVDQAYLVIPDLDYLLGNQGFHWLHGSKRFLEELILNHLPIGLIGFSPVEQGQWNFRVIYEGIGLDNLKVDQVSKWLIKGILK